MLRSKSLLKDKAFNIEETRIKDSGIESDEKNSGSNRSSINSSSSSQSMSPRGTESHLHDKNIIAAKVKAAVSKPTVKQPSMERNTLVKTDKKIVNEPVKTVNSQAQKDTKLQDTEKKVNANTIQKKAVSAQSSCGSKPVSTAKSQVTAGEMLRNVAKENAVKNTTNSAQQVTMSKSGENARSPSVKNNTSQANKITVHSNVLTELESKETVKDSVKVSTNKNQAAQKDIIVKELPNEPVTVNPVTNKTQNSSTSGPEIKASSVDTKMSSPANKKTPRAASSNSQASKLQPNTAREPQKKGASVNPANKTNVSKQTGPSKISAQGMQLSRNNAPKSNNKDQTSNKQPQSGPKSGPKVSVAPVINNAANPVKEHVTNVPENKKPDKTEAGSLKHKGSVDMSKILEPKPTISDPYEAIRSQHQASLLKENKLKEEQNVRNKSAGKTKMPLKNQKQPGKEKPQDKRQLSAAAAKKKSARGSREGAKSKEVNEQGKCKQRPKSGNKKTKKRRKKKEKTVITDKEDMSKVAFVSGQGWYVETECNENKILCRARRKHAADTDDSSDTDDEYLNKQYLKLKQADIDLSEHKYDDNLYWTSGSGTETDSETDYDADELPGMELAEEEVSFSARDLAQGPAGINLPGGRTITNKDKQEIQKLLIEEQKAQLSETPHTSAVSKTVTAINKFSKSVEDRQLEAMLSSTDKSNSPPIKKSASFNTKQSGGLLKDSNVILSGKAGTPRRSMSTDSVSNTDKKNVDINQNTPKISAIEPKVNPNNKTNNSSVSDKKFNNNNNISKQVPGTSGQKANQSTAQNKSSASLTAPKKGPASTQTPQTARKSMSQDNKAKTPRNSGKSSTGSTNLTAVKVGPVPDKMDEVKISAVPNSYNTKKEQNTKAVVKATDNAVVSETNTDNSSGKHSPLENKPAKDKIPISARKSVGDVPDDEEDIDSMIKEIMKNTPNPSLTLSFRNSGQVTPGTERTSPEEICQTLREKFDNDMDLLNTQRFQQVHVKRSEATKNGDESNLSTLKQNDETYTKNKDDTYTKDKDFNAGKEAEGDGGKDLEEQQLQKLIASLQHMELKVV